MNQSNLLRKVYEDNNVRSQKSEIALPKNDFKKLVMNAYNQIV